MINIQDLYFAYPENVSVFTGFNWKVEYSESWSILGLSGTGKTTLLFLLAGLVKADSGTISIAGEVLTRPRPGTGFVMQNHGLLPWLTVRKNIKLGFKIRRFYGIDGKHTPKDSKFDKELETETVEYWLDRLDINNIESKYPPQISGGQKQRAAIARTMILQPDLLLMDEPFTSLDQKTRESIQNLILDLDKENTQTRITVTHSLEEAVYLGKRIIILGKTGDGCIIFENPGAGLPSFRNSSKHKKMCSMLKAVMDSMP